MHLLLTDRLTCPRCGPAFGLILRTDAMEERRVRTGGLGCANCRELYPIEEGVGDLRPQPRPELPQATLSEPSEGEATMAHALLGVAEGPGELAVVGEAVRFAPVLAQRIPEIEIVAASVEARGGAPLPGVSRVVVEDRLPFFDRVLRGVLLEGPGAKPLLREAARVLAPRHRVVVLQAPTGSVELLQGAGLTVNLQQDGVVVAGR